MSSERRSDEGMSTGTQAAILFLVLLALALCTAALSNAAPQRGRAKTADKARTKNTRDRREKSVKAKAEKPIRLSAAERRRDKQLERLKRKGASKRQLTRERKKLEALAAKEKGGQVKRERRRERLANSRALKPQPRRDYEVTTHAVRLRGPQIPAPPALTLVGYSSPAISASDGMQLRQASTQEPIIPPALSASHQSMQSLATPLAKAIVIKETQVYLMKMPENNNSEIIFYFPDSPTFPDVVALQALDRIKIDGVRVYGQTGMVKLTIEPKLVSVRQLLERRFFREWMRELRQLGSTVDFCRK
jgi:hypothetical protein